MLYATDDWVGPYWGENTKQCDNTKLDGRQIQVAKEWDGKAPRQAHPQMHPYIKHTLYAPPNECSEEEALRHSLTTLAEEGAIKQSREAGRLSSE